MPAVGLEYFGNRGFTDAAIQKFSLGFALESWYAFAKAATQTGFKLEYHSLSGKVIAFAVC
ncbi:MAG: hypothetical protein H6577_27630 [Lewinellaceae bacterium]|nr:hypothetical protein [Lewinellaceae bacterium]